MEEPLNFGYPMNMGYSSGKGNIYGVRLSNTTSIRHRIKRCDRLLGNSKLERERHLIYAAMARRVMCGVARPLIIVDWSDLHADRAASLKVHRSFLKSLKAILPSDRQPIFVTDAGFRSTWFKLLDSMGYAWIGRIRNRDMVRPSCEESGWRGCKTLYAKAACEPKDLGQYHYVRCNPVACRLVLINKNYMGSDSIKMKSRRRCTSKNVP
jgi:hypothetical protein